MLSTLPPLIELTCRLRTLCPSFTQLFYNWMPACPTIDTRLIHRSQFHSTQRRPSAESFACFLSVSWSLEDIRFVCSNQKRDVVGERKQVAAAYYTNWCHRALPDYNSWVRISIISLSHTPGSPCILKTIIFFSIAFKSVTL